jgi:hypothetical protein
MSTAAATKERPIIFSAPMVQAILAGRKTQTRRIVKPQPPESLWAIWKRYPEQVGCPYGRPGDVLYVREGWQPARNGDTGETIAIYREQWEANGSPDGPAGFRWRSPIHMPRKASRITLEIESVKVERVDAISHADAIAEGVESWEATEGQYANIPAGTTIYRNYRLTGDDYRRAGLLHARESFLSLWESIHEPHGHHGRDSWPWVWCLTFRRS